MRPADGGAIPGGPIGIAPGNPVGTEPADAGIPEGPDTGELPDLPDNGACC